jgi:UDP-N-acetyl-D-glucosamine dehydrogenase
VNIALVNELATLAGDLGVDIWAAIEAAATKPSGYQPFWPGPGVGGHCIAMDPRIGQALNDVGKPIRNSRIMAVGLAYKADVNDIRESPSLMVMERLAGSGAICSYHDP